MCKYVCVFVCVCVCEVGAWIDTGKRGKSDSSPSLGTLAEHGKSMEVSPYYKAENTFKRGYWGRSFKMAEE